LIVVVVPSHLNASIIVKNLSYFTQIKS